MTAPQLVDGCDRCGDPGVNAEDVGKHQFCGKCHAEISRRCKDGGGRTVERVRCEWCRGKDRLESKDCHKCHGERSRDVVFVDGYGERDELWDYREAAWDRADFERDTG